MADYKMEDIRTFSLVGHGQCGKTSISDNILFKAGSVNRVGSVKDGTSVSDFTEEEKKRQVSISAGILNCMYKGKKFNIIDTPGYTDFFGDSVASFHAVDFAVIVVDANGGVQVNTRKSWDYVNETGIPAIVVVNKMDTDNLNVNEIMTRLQNGLSSKCTAVNYPDATGAGFSAVHNLLDKSADLSGDVADMQSELIENIVEADEELLERYLEEENVDIAELIGLLKTAIIEKSIIPVLFTSTSKGVGIEELMNFIADFGIAPGEGPKKLLFNAADLAVSNDESGESEDEESEAADPEPVEYTVAPDQKFKGFVFKIITDPYVGKMCYIRVVTGTATEGLGVNCAEAKKPVNLTSLLKVQGGSQESMSEALPGDIFAVAKIEDFILSDTLLEGEKGLAFKPMEFPEPMVSFAVFGKSRGDDQKISPALRSFAAEDPFLSVGINRETNELVMKGMGNLHLESILSRMKEKFNLEVDTKLPKIAFKETITGNAEVSHKHKKQTGGHGQYGEVHIRVRPCERGAGFSFVNAITGGVIPNQYIPAVEKGIVETMAKGLLAGFPIVDVEVELYFGSYHDVDSSEMAFKTAGREAFKKGFKASKPVLLEPIHKVEITIPASEMGNITGDINSRRGRIEGMDTIGEMQVIKAAIPEAELQTYSTELRSATGGEGSYTTKFDHYEVVPHPNAEKIIAKYKKEEEEE